MSFSVSQTRVHVSLEVFAVCRPSRVMFRLSGPWAVKCSGGQREQWCQVQKDGVQIYQNYFCICAQMLSNL